MWSYRVEMSAPGFDDDLRLAASAEPLDAQALVTELAVERFVRPVLPWPAGVDDGGFDAWVGEPLQDCVAQNSGPLSKRR